MLQVTGDRMQLSTVFDKADRSVQLGNLAFFSVEVMQYFCSLPECVVLPSSYIWTSLFFF